MYLPKLTYVSGCVLVAWSYLTLCDPMNCSPPGSSVHGILHERKGCQFLLQRLCQRWLHRSWLHSCRSVSGLYVQLHWSVCSPDAILSGLLQSGSWVVSILQVCSLLVLSFASLCKPQNHFREIHKITSWNFHLDCIASIRQVGKNWHFDSIEASYSRTQNISLFSFSLILFIRVL